MIRRFTLNLFTILLAVVLSGCTTVYVDTTKATSPPQNPLQSAVLFEINPEFASVEPKCISVLPFVDDKGLDLDGNFRKAFHAQLSVTGVRLVPLQAKAQTGRAKEACDFELRGKILENSRVFLGVYSEYRAGAEVELVEAKSKKFFWRARHVMVKRSGGVPLDIFSTLAGAASAALNLESAQTGRITFELADRVIRSIPNLGYRDTDQSAKADENRAPALPAQVEKESFYGFMASTERLSRDDQLTALERYLANEKTGEDYARRLVAEKILILNKDHIAANRVILVQHHRQGNDSAVIETSSRLIALQPSERDLLSIRAQAYSRSGSKELAIKDYVKAVSLGDESEETLTRLGGTYGALGRFDLAVAAYDRILQKDPSNFKTLLLSGVAQAAEGDTEKAYEKLRRVLVMSLAREDKALARRAVNAMHSTGTFELLSDNDRRFIEGKL